MDISMRNQILYYDYQ